MLRARKRLLPPRAGGEPSLPDALKDAPSTPERSPPKLQACLLRPTASREAAIGTTCDARCLYTDALHTGLCVTVDGLAPPSIKRRHLLFKLESAMCIYAQRDMGGVDTHLDDEGDETKRQSSHGSEN